MVMGQGRPRHAEDDRRRGRHHSKFPKGPHVILLCLPFPEIQVSSSAYLNAPVAGLFLPF
jgi:hypothetical protein